MGAFVYARSSFPNSSELYKFSFKKRSITKYLKIELGYDKHRNDLSRPYTHL